MRIRITASLTTIALVILTGCSALVPMERPSVSVRTLMLWMPEASGVQVVADWNDWSGLEAAGGSLDPSSGVMTDTGDGIWALEVGELPAGRYRYSFLVNGYRWVVDPVNPETAEYKGRTVSLLIVPD